MDNRRIDHFIVLMLENRSFDHLLGDLDYPSFPHVDLSVFEVPDRLDSPTVTYRPEVTGDRMIWRDPPHSHVSAVRQINGGRMDGFVDAYLRKTEGKEDVAIVHTKRIWAAISSVLACIAAVLPIPERWRVGIAVLASTATAVGVKALARALRPKATPDDPETPAVVRVMPKESIPVLAALAEGFAVCTRWFCSVPGETWPNRTFAHAATSVEAVDIEFGLYDCDTVFDLVEPFGGFHIYRHDIPHVAVFNKLWTRDRIRDSWHPFSDFATHVASGRLPAYSFIEPSYTGAASNSQHPGSNQIDHSRPATERPAGSTDFERAEALVAEIYQTLLDNPDVFARTALVITYDEHGGFFDHVPPRSVPAPLALRRRVVRHVTRRFIGFFVERGKSLFNFRQTGPRVPAIVVSPWVAAGTVDDTCYDHSSIVATVSDLFVRGRPWLTQRDRTASSLRSLLDQSDEMRPISTLPPVPPHAAPVPNPAPSRSATASQYPETPSTELEKDLARLAPLVDARLSSLGAPPARRAAARQAVNGVGADVMARVEAFAAALRND